MNAAFSRFFARAAIVLCLAGWVAPVYAATGDAVTYVSGLADQTLATISNEHLSKRQKQAKLNRLFADNIDFPWVGRFVMGRYWREATGEQKARYLKEYQKFLILHYTSRFTEYTSGDFKVTGSEDDGNGEFTVSMQISSGDQSEDDQPVLVDYRVRREDKGFRIFDVIVEGVSMITTQRSEFASVIAKGGIGYLIDQLAAKSKTGDLTVAGGKGGE